MITGWHRIERDSAGFVDGANLYQYGNGDPASGLDPDGNVVILLHGVNPDDWYQRFTKQLQEGFAASGSGQQDVLGFDWGKDVVIDATDQYRDMSKYAHEAAKRLAKLVAALRELYREFGCADEPINVIAHSQGAMVTMNALALEQMKLSNFVLLGSPMDVDDYYSMAEANGMAASVGKVHRYWSEEDGATFWKGGNVRWPKSATVYIWTKGASEYANVPRTLRLSKNIAQHELVGLDHSDFMNYGRIYARDLGVKSKSDCCTSKNPAFTEALEAIRNRFTRPKVGMKGGYLFNFEARQSPPLQGGSFGSADNAFDTRPGWDGLLRGTPGLP